MPVAAGRRSVLFELFDPVPDGTPVTFNPDRVWGAVSPQNPGAYDENRPVGSLVTIPFHRQVTTNTRLRYSRHGAIHELFVRGVQNPDLADRELVLYCEEVLTP